MTLRRILDKRLLLALGCGVACAALLLIYTGDLKAQATNARDGALAAYGGELVDVYVVTRDITPGESLGSDNTAKETWVAALLPQGAISDASGFTGLAASQALFKGEPVLASKLGGAAEPVKVPEGMCALSIAVDDVQAVGGAIGAGSAVDVYAAGASGVSLVVCDVLVLETSSGLAGSIQGAASKTQGGATLQGTSSARPALKWVTLAVAPEMVQQLLAAAREKSLTLVLPGNDASASASGADAAGAAAAGAAPLAPSLPSQGGGAGSSKTGSGASYWSQLEDGDEQ
jgi:pilus assembly protein CpaB